MFSPSSKPWMVENGGMSNEMVFDFPKAADPRKDRKRSNLGRIRVIQKLMAQGGQDFNPSIPTPVSAEYHPDNWSEGIRF